MMVINLIIIVLTALGIFFQYNETIYLLAVIAGLIITVIQFVTSIVNGNNSGFFGVIMMWIVWIGVPFAGAYLITFYAFDFVDIRTIFLGFTIEALMGIISQAANEGY